MTDTVDCRIGSSIPSLHPHQWKPLRLLASRPTSPSPEEEFLRSNSPSLSTTVRVPHSSQPLLLVLLLLLLLLLLCCCCCCCSSSCNCCEVVEELPCWLAASTLDYFTVGAFSEASSRPYNNKAAGTSVFPFTRKSTPDTPDTLFLSFFLSLSLSLSLSFSLSLIHTQLVKTKQLLVSFVCVCVCVFYRRRRRRRKFQRCQWQLTRRPPKENRNLWLFFSSFLLI